MSLKQLATPITTKLSVLRGEGGVLAGVSQSVPRIALELGYFVIILAAVDISIDGRLAFREAAVIEQEAMLVAIPEVVYVYALLGAGVYVATSLVFDPKESVPEVKRLGYRMLAALPLGAGVFLLATVIPGTETVGLIENQTAGEALETSAGVVGLVFLAGLFVRLTLEKLGDLAETIYNTGDVRRLPHRELQRRYDAMANIREAWEIAANQEVAAEELSTEGYELLRKAETLLESEDATLQQLDRAVNLSEEARAAFQR